MVQIKNPYRPGAGLMPGYLAGREEVIRNTEDSFTALKEGIPVQSIAFTGYRGVGKTVLLNKLQEIAEDGYGIAAYYTEVTKTGSFIAKLSDHCRKYLRSHSFSEKAKKLLEKAVDALKSLEISYNPENPTFHVSMQEKILFTNADLSQGLQELFEAIGQIAKKRELPVCFFVDEFQYASQDEMDAFISALHRANQLSFPIMAVCGGTPEMIKMLHKEKTYVERLFLFPKLEMLTESEVWDALTIPGERVHLIYTEAASRKITDFTGGYPFFVQVYGQLLYKLIEEGEKVDADFVNHVLPDYYRELDQNFYMVRFSERGALEKECMVAMAKAKKLPCTVAIVAKELNKTIKQITPTLARLKNKGLIRYDSISEIDFTVPGFDGYIRRQGL